MVAASSFLFALTFTSLQTRVWDSNISSGMLCSQGSTVWGAAVAAAALLLAQDGRLQMPVGPAK